MIVPVFVSRFANREVSFNLLGGFDVTCLSSIEVYFARHVDLETSEAWWESILDPIDGLGIVLGHVAVIWHDDVKVDQAVG
jgi:hypothetical protein